MICSNCRQRIQEGKEALSRISNEYFCSPCALEEAMFEIEMQKAINRIDKQRLKMRGWVEIDQ